MFYAAPDEELGQTTHPDGPPTLDATTTQPEEFRLVFRNFLRTFNLGGVPVYRDLIKGLGLHLTNIDDGVSSVTVASLALNLDHIIVAGSWVASETDGTAFTEAWSDAIVACFKSFPLKFISHAEEAVKDVYIELHEGAGRVLNVSRNTLSPVQLEVVCSEQPTRLRALVHSRVESLVVVPCMVVSCSKPQYKAVSVRLLCRECGHKASVRLPTWQQSVDIPRRCGGSSEDQSCGPDQYVVVPEESTYTDLQIVKLQDPPELMDASEMPQHVQLVLPGALAGRVSPGQRLYVVGCYTSFDRNISGGGVVKSYIHGLGLCVHPDDLVRKMKTSESLASWSYEEEEVFRKLASDPNIFDMLWRSVAPAIFGLDDVKKSIVCQLFGGTSKSSPQKAKLRADINILLLGDPSTAKSHFLQFVHAVAPVCIYTSGKGSSAAGLTATIVKDRHQNFALEGGAMVLADGGIVCIDEFDKMREDDRVAIHEAMEQQTVSIAKAGITTVLSTRCSVLAAANPSFGSYDDSKETSEQHDFESTILSRFDLIWVIRDERNVERDRRIAGQVVDLFSGTKRADSHSVLPAELLRSYITYCRSVCHPTLSNEAVTRLGNFYVQVREELRSDARKRRDQIPITIRQLESLVRLSESVAKMSLTREVSSAHVEAAIALFRSSTVEAAKSHIGRETLTGEELENLKAAEQAILDRLPMNSRSSKRRIIADLRTRGLDPYHVGRALRVLVTKGLVQIRGDSTVYRGAE